MNGTFLVEPEAPASSEFDRFARGFRARWPRMSRTERYRAVTGLGVAFAKLAGLDAVEVASSAFGRDRVPTVIADATLFAREIRAVFDREKA